MSDCLEKWYITRIVLIFFDRYYNKKGKNVIKNYKNIWC